MMTVTSTADSKLSPMAAYTVRKILLSQVKQLSGADEAAQQLAETTDINVLLQMAYASDDDRRVQTQQLEVLATSYQTLSHRQSLYGPELKQIEQQILHILPRSVWMPRTPANPSLKLQATPASPQPTALISGSNGTIADALLLMNTLFKVSSELLGVQITQRSLSDAQTKIPDLTLFSVTHKGVICPECPSSPLQGQIVAGLQAWLTSHIQYCSRILPDFPLYYQHAYQELTRPALNSLNSLSSAD